MGIRKHVAVALLIVAVGVDCAPAEDLPSAEALWERVIDAKGGRQRLHAVRSILISEGEAKRGRTHHVTLFVFPDASWQYIDNGRSILGRSVRMIRGDLAMRSSQPRFATKPHLLSFPALRDGMWEFISASTVHLLETAWSRPELFNAGTAKLNRRPHYTVDASSEGASFRYFIDAQTLMVSRVAALNGEAYNCIGHLYDFLGYSETDGILMASEIRGAEGDRWPIRYSFNVEYRSDLFDVPPDVEDGPDGWRKQ